MGHDAEVDPDVALAEGVTEQQLGDVVPRRGLRVRLEVARRAHERQLAVAAALGRVAHPLCMEHVAGVEAHLQQHVHGPPEPEHDERVALVAGLDREEDDPRDHARGVERELRILHGLGRGDVVGRHGRDRVDRRLLVPAEEVGLRRSRVA